MTLLSGFSCDIVDFAMSSFQLRHSFACLELVIVVAQNVDSLMSAQ